MKRTVSILVLAAMLLPVSLSAKKAEAKINVVPYPQFVELEKGTFTAAGAMFNCDPAIDGKTQKIIKELADKITFVSGKTCSFAAPVGMVEAANDINRQGNFIGMKYEVKSMKGFVFLLQEDMGPEEYSIKITKKNCIVSASAYNGFLYAIQTLKQMTSNKIYGSTVDANEKFLLPCCTIKDAPRFAYRGMMLDCARHFFSVEEVKKFLDVMAMHKLNRLHWHLTEDQGWRMEVKKYPKLTEIGAYRNGTMIARDFSSNDGIRYGGYYTQEQMKEVVAYAESLGITVIPEIDLPGHMLGALAAYPELGCTGGPYEVWTKWGISDQVLCPGKENMFNFLEDVFTELMEIFPSEYIHIGGDECPKTEWAKCPDCQARIASLGIKADEQHSAEQYLQSYVTSRIQKFINEHGRKIIGWDEILEGDLDEGATVMSWRGVTGGVKASARGYDVIMSPNTYCYFDYLQGPQEEEPVGIGGNLPMDKVYSYEPFDGLDEGQQKHILGVQANLWTEYIATPEHLEYMLLPRMAALSEIQWCNSDRKDYDRFTESLESSVNGIYDVLGYNYKNYNK